MKQPLAAANEVENERHSKYARQSKATLKWALLLSRLWLWIQARNVARLDAKRLRVLETVSLGEKRFVAVVQFDNQQFLIGSCPTSVALLAPLNVSATFDETLQKLSSPRKRKAKAEAKL